MLRQMQYEMAEVSMFNMLACSVYANTLCVKKIIIDSPEQILYVPGGRHLIVCFSIRYMCIPCVYTRHVLV